MTVSLKGLGAITLFVEGLERSRSFYQDGFDLQVINEEEDSAAFDFGKTIINCSEFLRHARLLSREQSPFARRDRVFS